MIENAIISLIAGDATVVAANAALGTQASTYSTLLKAQIGTVPRAFRVTLPKNSRPQIDSTTAPTFPAILIGRQETPERTLTHGGPGTLTNARLELHVVAADSLACAKVLANARKLFDGWKGAAGSTTGGLATITVDGIWVEGGKDIPNDTVGGEEFPFAQSMIELDCWFREPLA